MGRGEGEAVGHDALGKPLQKSIEIRREAAKETMLGGMRFRHHAHVRKVVNFIFTKIMTDSNFIFSNHWRLGIVEKPNQFLEGKTCVCFSNEILI